MQKALVESEIDYFLCSVRSAENHRELISSYCAWAQSDGFLAIPLLCFLIVTSLTD